MLIDLGIPTEFQSQPTSTSSSSTTTTIVNELADEWIQVRREKRAKRITGSTSRKLGRPKEATKVAKGN